MISRYECWIKLCHCTKFRFLLKGHWEGRKWVEDPARAHYDALVGKYADLHQEIVKAESQADNSSD
jgi:hypothetical protein